MRVLEEEDEVFFFDSLLSDMWQQMGYWTGSAIHNPLFLIFTPPNLILINFSAYF
jgi:hypothetical protein